MPKYGFAINKSIAWRGSQEVFSNIYFLDGPELNAANAQTVVGRLVALEKDLHDASVTFRSARVWSAGGTAAENTTILITDLAGTGLRAAGVPISGEDCYVVQWITNRPSSTGRPVTLKKWLRLGSTLAQDLVSTRNNLIQIAPESVTRLTQFAQALMPLESTAGNYTLVAPSSNRTAVTPKIFRWIEHHELEY